MSLSIEKIFSDYTLQWGKKYSPNTPLIELWNSDRDYLLWGAKLSGKNNKDSFSLPPLQLELVVMAYLFETGKVEEAEKRFSHFKRWYDLTQQGIGIEKLKKAEISNALNSIENCEYLVAHTDLDGLMSAAILIKNLSALSKLDSKNKYRNLRLMNYGGNTLRDFTEQLEIPAEKSFVTVDFATHPDSALTIDHHATSLSFIELGAKLPPVVLDLTAPSCPHLIDQYFNLGLPKDLISNCNKIDGAQYQNLNETTDLSNPYIALELCLKIAVGDNIQINVVKELVESNLDVNAVLESKSFKARIDLIKTFLDEQRDYFKNSDLIDDSHELYSIVDGSFAPHPLTLFRYMPFESKDVINRPYLISIRSQRRRSLNLGLSRNPFYPTSFFENKAVNLGGLAKRLGKGGGRVEAASLMIPAAEKSAILKIIGSEIESIHVARD